jgi:hypothetical protein
MRLSFILPFLFLYPHVRRRFVIHRDVQDADTSFDLVSNVISIIRIRIDRVAEWIGEGDLFSKYNLFPLPAYDCGYELLLHRRDLFETEPQLFQQLYL